MSAPAANTFLPWAHLKPASRKHRRHDKILWLIGAVKIFYGVILLVVGIGAWNLAGKNLSAELERWVQWWNIDFNNASIQMLFRKAAALDGPGLYVLAFIILAYAAVLFVAGTGLILEKYWAKWLMVVVSGSLVPGELYYVIRELSWPPLVLLLLNVISVCYLVWRIQTHEHPPKSKNKNRKVKRSLSHS